MLSLPSSRGIVQAAEVELTSSPCELDSSVPCVHGHEAFGIYPNHGRVNVLIPTPR
jgi:hypothetical protein